MGAGPVLQAGTFRFAFNTVRGFGFEGGHLETNGLNTNGQVIPVPLHRHEITLDYLQMELEFEYAWADRWSLLMRIPYEIKDQKAKINFLEAATLEERQAITRNQDIHHRNKQYQGLTDFTLLARNYRQGLLRKGDSLEVSAGTTLPVGKTEADPYELGDRGLKHLHIQFGTGTFDPLLEVNYRMPLSQGFSIGAFGLGRFPFYENQKTYRGPVEGTTGIILGYRWKPWVSFHAATRAHYKNFAYWKGKRDINSGLVTAAGLFGGIIKVGKKTRLGMDLWVPFFQNTLTEGDTFKHGLTVVFKISQVW